METLSFAFGMLAMVAIILLIVIVAGIVKVLKLEKELKELDRTSSREIEFVHKRIAEVERDIYAELNETRNRFDRFTDDLRRELQAYTDSRADKLEQKLTGKKQLLKD